MQNSEELTPLQAIELHNNMLQDTMNLLAKFTEHRIFIAWSEDPGPSRHISNLSLKNYTSLIQESGDFAQRFQDIWDRVIEINPINTIIIGSDCPQLSEDILKQAIQESKQQVVLGPTPDKGFYLLAVPEKLTKTSFFKVFQEQNQIAQIKTIFDNKCFVLPTLRDIDTIEDLHYFSSKE